MDVCEVCTKTTSGTYLYFGGSLLLLVALYLSGHVTLVDELHINERERPIDVCIGDMSRCRFGSDLVVGRESRRYYVEAWSIEVDH